MKNVKRHPCGDEERTKEFKVVLANLRVAEQHLKNVKSDVLQQKDMEQLAELEKKIKEQIKLLNEHKAYLRTE